VACDTWRKLLPVLTRAGDSSPEDAAAFRAGTARFVDGLRAAFPWFTVTPKLHTLCCHAPDFLDFFGSLGRYSEQGLEAWHGHFNQTAAGHPADSFLATCVSYVKRSAVSRAPRDAAHNRGAKRSPAKAGPGARDAKRLDDKRTRTGKILAGAPGRRPRVCLNRARTVASGPRTTWRRQQVRSKPIGGGPKRPRPTRMSHALTRRGTGRVTMVSCLRQKRLACCPFWRSRNPLGLLHVLIDQSTLSENLSDLANSPPSLIHTVCMAGHQSQVQWGAWDGPGSRVVGGACTLVDVLTRSGLPRQSSENTKAKRHRWSIIQKGPAKFWRVVVQTRLQCALVRALHAIA